MLRVLLVGAAGAIGAVSRYGLVLAFGTRSFPWTTLLVNVAGSAALGFVLAGPAAGRWSSDATIAVTVGFLAAFTTFSTFAFEVTALVRDGRAPAAGAYVAASVALGLLAATIGWLAGQRIAA